MARIALVIILCAIALGSALCAIALWLATRLLIKIWSLLEEEERW